MIGNEQQSDGYGSGGDGGSCSGGSGNGVCYSGVTSGIGCVGGRVVGWLASRVISVEVVTAATIVEILGIIMVL